MGAAVAESEMRELVAVLGYGVLDDPDRPVLCADDLGLTRGDGCFDATRVVTDADGTYPEGLAAQTRRCVERIAEALAAFDATLEQVIKVRIYTTDITRWEEIASVMGPAFAETRPANLLVGVSELVDGALIEIEAEAWVG